MIQNCYQWLFQGKSNVWMAIFTGVLTVYTILLYMVANSTHEFDKRNKRPFVFHEIHAVAKGVDRATGKVTDFQMGISWRNTGDTPVKTAMTNSSYQLVVKDLADDFSFPDITNTPPQRVVIPPRGRSEHVLMLRMDDMRAVYENKGKIIV